MVFPLNINIKILTIKLNKTYIKDGTFFRLVCSFFSESIEVPVNDRDKKQVGIFLLESYTNLHDIQSD